MDKAKLHYIKTIELNPEHARAHNDLGVILTKQGNLQGAINHFNSAISIIPGFVYPYFNLAYVQSLQGDFNSACSNYTYGLSLEPAGKEIIDAQKKYCKK